MLALTLIPANVWRAPQYDATYTGFDPNLVYAPPVGFGSIKASRSTVDVEAGAGSSPEFVLATTPLRRLAASVDVTVAQYQNAREPFRLGVWSPWTHAGFFVVFKSDGTIAAETLANGFNGVSLHGGDVVIAQNLGSFELGKPYRVQFVLDKSGGILTAQVSESGGLMHVASVTSRQAPKLFNDFALSLSGSADGGSGSAHILLTGFVLQLPHERLWASKIDDPRAQVLLVLLAIAGLVLAAFMVGRRWRARFARLPEMRRPGLSGIAFGLLGVALIVYLAGNALLFRLGGHPFDIRAEQLYAYVAHTYGASQLYYLPNVVSLPMTWQGVPQQEFAFPYQAVFAYLEVGIGWVANLVGGGRVVLETLQLQFVIKSVNVLFGLGDGILIYSILRSIGTGVRWSLVPAALWLFNPAVWFSMSIWGQTHVISLFFALAAVLLAEKRHPTAAWLALTAACLTRPQMLIFGLLIGIALLRKFSWRENVSALSWTLIITFVGLIPLTLATSPSLPIDILINTFRSHESGVPGLINIVSQDAYSVWPLVENWTQGATGFHTAFNPNNVVILGPITFQRLSQILTLLSALIVGGFLWFRRGASEEAGGYLPYVALGAMAFLMLFFDIIATHFLLALPFLILIRRWTGGVAYFYIVAIWSVTTFVTMYGDMGVDLAGNNYPLLDSAHNAITRFVVRLNTSDRFVAAGILGNICAVIWLGYLTLRSSPSRRPSGAFGATSP